MAKSRPITKTMNIYNKSRELSQFSLKNCENFYFFFQWCALPLSFQLNFNLYAFFLSQYHLAKLNYLLEKLRTMTWAKGRLTTYSTFALVFWFCSFTSTSRMKQFYICIFDYVFLHAD